MPGYCGPRKNAYRNPVKLLSALRGSLRCIGCVRINSSGSKQLQTKQNRRSCCRPVLIFLLFYVGYNNCKDSEQESNVPYKSGYISLFCLDSTGLSCKPVCLIIPFIA